MSASLKCSICSRIFILEMTDAEYERYMGSSLSAQECFPNKDSFFREALISHMCYDCQSKVFHKPKPGEDWGPVVCECEVCGAPVYTSDDNMCSCCGNHVSGEREDCEA